MHRFALIVALLLLSGCGLMTPLTGKETVLGMPVQDTILIVEEDFTIDGHVLPAGVYYPNMGVTNGWILYVGSRPLTVKRLFRSLQCVGGVQINAKQPYVDYDLFYYGCGDPVTAIHIPKKLRFRIEPRLGLPVPKTASVDVGPNPSLQPTRYGWLRQPPRAAELKR